MFNDMKWLFWLCCAMCKPKFGTNIREDLQRLGVTNENILLGNFPTKIYLLICSSTVQHNLSFWTIRENSERIIKNITFELWVIFPCAITHHVRRDTNDILKCAKLTTNYNLLVRSYIYMYIYIYSMHNSNYYRIVFFGDYGWLRSLKRDLPILWL